MSWRVNWYRANKSEPLIITHEVGNNGDAWDDVEINGECICCNSGTEFWKNLKYNNEDFRKEIKCLYDHPDCDYYFNIDLSDRKLVSGSWMYKYAIFDMIFIYKTFDWENDLMVVYGG